MHMFHNIIKLSQTHQLKIPPKWSLLQNTVREFELQYGFKSITPWGYQKLLCAAEL